MAECPSAQRRDHDDRVVERGEDEENDELENYEEDEQLEDVELKTDLLPRQVVRDCSCDVLTPATFTVRERRWG